MKGDLQKALTDVRSLTEDPLEAGSNFQEAQEMVHRLEQTLKSTTKKQRSKARALMTHTPSVSAQQQQMQMQQQQQIAAMQQQAQARKPAPPLTLKVTFGSDTRMIQVPGHLAFTDLTTIIRRKFPDDAGNLQVTTPPNIAYLRVRVESAAQLARDVLRLRRDYMYLWDHMSRWTTNHAKRCFVF
jgi:hypothetical protein